MEKINETIVKQSKKLIDKVLSYIITVSNLFVVALSEILELECGVWKKKGLYIILTKTM